APHAAHRRDRPEGDGGGALRGGALAGGDAPAGRLPGAGRPGRKRVRARRLLGRAAGADHGRESIPMTALLGALTQGLLLSLLALGVFISFRVFAFADITVEGSISLGACVTSVLLITDPVPLAHALPWAGAAGAAVAVSLAYLLLAEGKMWRTVLGAAL